MLAALPGKSPATMPAAARVANRFARVSATDQHDDIEPAIAPLSGNAPDQILSLNQPNLELDAARLTGCVRHHYVPGSKVARIADRDFRSNGDARGDQPPKAVEERQVGHIADWFAPGVGPSPQVETDDGTSPR